MPHKTEVLVKLFKIAEKRLEDVETPQEEDWKEVYEDSGFTSTSMDRSSPASTLICLLCAENLLNYTTRYLGIT